MAIISHVSDRYGYTIYVDVGVPVLDCDCEFRRVWSWLSALENDRGSCTYAIANIIHGTLLSLREPEVFVGMV